MLSDEIKKVHNQLSELLHIVTKEQAEILLRCKNCLLDCAEQAECIEKTYEVTTKCLMQYAQNSKEQEEEC